jgi:T5orf172 domain
MSSGHKQTSEMGDGLPFVRTIARELAEELFRQQAQWKTGELVSRVAELHCERGGSLNTDPQYTMIRVLKDLKVNGDVISVASGWWKWAKSASDSDCNSNEAETYLTASIDDMVEEIEPALQPEHESGTGRECVYLYFNPNDKLLAELQGRDVWECKIGRTSSNEPIHRILGQGIRTSLSRFPTIGLVLRTDDSAAIERALHASLRLIEAEVPDSPGNEWFYTSPDHVKAWYVNFQNVLASLRGSD